MRGRKQTRIDDEEEETENIETQVATLIERTKNIQDMVAKINQQLESNYVTMDKFIPIRNLVYGMVGIILSILIKAIIESRLITK